MIFMKDGTQKLIKDVNIGDEVIGAVREGRYYKYVPTVVLNKFETEQDAYEITTQNGTKVTCGPDDRWKASRGLDDGWKYTTPQIGREYLTNKIGISCASNLEISYPETRDYKIGYLCAVILGDAHLAIHKWNGKGRINIQYHFRLACKDKEIIEATDRYLKEIYELHCHQFLFPMKLRSTKKIVKFPAIRLHTKECYRKLHELEISAFKGKHSGEWLRGFLAGAFDAEGGDTGVLRIFNTDLKYLCLVSKGMKSLNFSYVQELVSISITGKRCFAIRLMGGLRPKSKFFLSVCPKITRKFNIFSRQVKGSVKIVAVKNLHKKQRIYSIITKCGNYFVNGLLSYNGDMNNKLK